MRRHFITILGIATSLTVALGAAEASHKEIDELNASAKQALAAKQYDAAEKGYRQVLEKEPQNQAALQGLGDTLTAEGKHAEAADAYEHLADALLHPKAATPRAATRVEQTPPRTIPTPTHAPTLTPAAAATPPAAHVDLPKLMPPPDHKGQTGNGCCGYIHGLHPRRSN